MQLFRKKKNARVAGRLTRDSNHRTLIRSICAETQLLKRCSAYWAMTRSIVAARRLPVCTYWFAAKPAAVEDPFSLTVSSLDPASTGGESTEFSGDSVSLGATSPPRIGDRLDKPSAAGICLVAVSCADNRRRVAFRFPRLAWLPKTDVACATAGMLIGDRSRSELKSAVKD